MPIGGAGANHSEGVDELIQEFVNGRWYLRNPRMARAVQRGLTPESFTTEWSLFTETERKFLPFNGELLMPLGFEPFLGTYLGEANGNSVILSVERRRGQGSFSLDDVREVLRVMPALQQATRIAVCLADARDAGLAEGLDRLSFAALLLDHDARPIRANASGEALLRSDLSVGPTGLTTQHRASAARLRDAIGAALAFPTRLARPGRLAIQREAQPPLLVDVAPLPGASEDLFRRAKAIVIIDDPERVDAADAEALQRLFGLTPSEARVAAAVGQGRSPAEASEALGVTVLTVRSTLKSVYAKLGVNRQSQLAALVARLAAFG
jgi:DNA-binding CsgD family transcriptional regulator